MATGLQLVGMAILLLSSSAIRSSMFVNAAYASDSSGVHQERQRLTSTDGNSNIDNERITSSFHVERPLSPPFPNGPCDGTVITIPQNLFPSQRRRATTSSSSSSSFPFFDNWDDLASSYEDAILPPRDVKVWLPRGYHSYENHNLRFPVLYCHDGQNAMDDASSWTGSSWRLTGALTRLSERNMFRTDTPPVVVLIPSMEGNFFLPGLSRRHSEYGDYTNPISQAYGKFVAEVLHPYIVDRFRIKDDVEHVATIGSSLGGQASLQLLLRYPTIFGAAACLSPCFQPGTIAAVIANIAAMDGGRGRLEKVRTMDHPNRNSLRSKVIYMDIGGDVDVTRVPIFDAHDHFTMNDKFWNPGYWWLDTNLQPMVDAMRLVLDGGGVQHTYKTFPGGRHNERAWAQRIHHPLLALYGNKSASIIDE